MTFLVCDIQRFFHLSFSFLSISQQHQIKSYMSFSCTNQSDSFPRTYMPPVTPPHLSFPAHLFFLFCAWCPSLCMVPLAYSLHVRDFPTGHLMMLLLSKWFPAFKSTLRCAAFSREHLLLRPSNWVFRHHITSHRTLLYCAGCLWFAHFYSPY